MRLERKKRRWNGNPPPPAAKANGYALTHGLRPLREAVKRLGGRVIDKRTSLGKTLAKWRADLIDDLAAPPIVFQLNNPHSSISALSPS
jgi:hypothetical protein